MKISMEKTCVFIFISIASLVMYYDLQGQTQTSVMVSPYSMKIKVSQSISIDVKVQNVVNLFAASVIVAFDSTILRYNNIIAGSFLTQNNTHSVFFGVVLQPPPPQMVSRITVDQAIAGGGGVSGSGTLFTIQFIALRSGQTPITIVSTDLRDRSNKSIQTQSVSGQVSVNIAPSGILLLSPPNGSIIDTTLNVKLIWSKSIDCNNGDTVRYGLHVKSTFSSLSICNVSDTTYTLTNQVLKGNTEYTWYIDATDGFDTTLSGQKFSFRTPRVTGIKRNPDRVPNTITLEQNYPNPFNPLTTIRFSVSVATHVSIRVYDLLGHEIVQLISDDLESGHHIVTWDGTDSKGTDVGSGIYFYIVTGWGHREVKKMILLR